LYSHPIAGRVYWSRRTIPGRWGVSQPASAPGPAVLLSGLTSQEEDGMELRRIGVVSAGKVAAVLYGVIGLLFGVLAALAVVFGLTLGDFGEDLGSSAAIYAVVLVVVMPIVYAAAGFVMAAIGALVYNLIARVVGGVELELQQ
jgi:hypothetical protein